MVLTHCSDADLLALATELVGSHREITARLVACLGEIEGRRLHLVAGFHSMFEFCTRELRMSEGEAFRRILAARLGRRFPVVHTLLASGAVHLSTLELVREHLTESNHAELLTVISGKGKRDVALLLAVRFPRADVPSRIRRGRIGPLAEHRFKVEFSASDELVEKLELCRDLMSHANPTRDIGVIVDRALELLLDDLQRKRLARSKQPRPPRGTPRTASPRISNEVRRRVYERDGLQCTYVSPDGRRCEARSFLELDHAHPRALGGGNQAENLRVRCRAHNQLWAEQAFGRRNVEGCRTFASKSAGSFQKNGSAGDVPTTPKARSATLEQVVPVVS
jgi:5-methylcytosine-specific restriction endonuclease McrA